GLEHLTGRAIRAGTGAPGDLVAQGLPVAVDGVEVGAPVLRAALGVDGCVQVGAADPGALREAALGLLPGAALQAYAVPGQARRGVQGADVAQHARVDPGVAGVAGAADVLGVGGQPGDQLEPGLGGDLAQPLQRGPGALGVDVVG